MIKGIQNQYVDQSFDKEINVVYALFKKFTPFTEFLPIFERSYELMQHHKSKKALINIKNLTVHDPQTIEYINNVWFPTTAKVGGKYVAFVLPDSSIGKMSTKSAHKSAEKIEGMIVNNFTNELEARKWLKSLTHDPK